MAKDKLRVGVIGVGMGSGHIAGYQKDPRSEVAAVCDVNEERLQGAAERLHVAPELLYTDSTRMFEEAELDAVSIAVPNKYHAPLTIAALKHGLHVLCEKPMAMTVKEAEQMQAAADKAGKNLMINFSYRFSEMSQALKQQVDAGVVGDIYFGRTVWHRRRGIPGFGGWFTTKELAGGGPLIDLGVHRVDLALWLMGYPDPVAISGSAYNKIAGPLAKKAKKTYSVEDLACGVVKFDNGATLIVEASWAVNNGQPEEMITQLYGTRGWLVQRNTGGGYNFEAELYTDEGGNLFTKKLDQSMNPSPSAYSEFVSSIVEERPPLATGAEGIRVMKILEGLYKSAETGKEVRFGR
jgi:predicted dehydrogenase